MRVHRLEIEGFGPFRGAQAIDFDGFADDGIFLITGKTGAGKSSILDAICFALYESVPRYEGGARRVRSDHARDGEPSRVALEFSTAAGRYRVERTPEYLRPKKHGAGMTPQKATAQLAQWVDGDWVGLAARGKEVGELLGEIIGLTREQFLQVILLAQNRFAQFLQAEQPQRQALLRTLFGTRRFEDYETALETRRRDARTRLERGGDGLESAVLRAEGALAEAHALHAQGEAVHAEATGLGESGDAGGSGALTARIAACELGALRVVAWVQAGEAGLEALAAERGRLEAEVSRLEAVAAHQRRRDASLLALAEIDDAEAGIAASREEVRLAREAAAVRHAIEAALLAADARASAEAQLESAELAWREAGEPEVADDALAPLLDTRVRASGGLDDMLALERALPEQAAQVAALDAQTDELGQAIEAAEAAAALAPARVRELDEAIAQAYTQAARVDDDRSAVADLVAAVDAAGEAESIAQLALAAQRGLRDRGAELTAASGEVDRLRELRFRGIAGELAAALVAGEPCQVCGALEHPAPRIGDGEPITQEQIDEAMAIRDACIERERAAAEHARAAEQSLADARVRSGGRELGALRPLLAAAEAQLTAAEVVAARHGELVTARAALLARHESAARELDETRTQHSAVIARRGQAQGEHRAARTQVEAARAGFASVRERREDAERGIERARELAQARAERERCAAADAAATVARDVALGGHGFASSAQALEALRTDAEVAAMEARVRAHGEQRAHHRSVLLEPELLALPEEPVDTEHARAASAEAKGRHDVALRAQLRIEALARQLREAIDEAARRGGAVAELDAEHALIEGLANAVAGRAPNTHRMKLEAFVLAAELEEIVEAANRRLAIMSGERYRLEHSDELAARGKQSGLGLAVLDQHTGRLRPTHSLSGGETFLASLALALGLAEVVSARAGGITLDTLFIDEGFGSLDGATLEIAMATLDDLRQGGRVVGLISHVEAMKEQIHAHLLVDVAPQGWSEVRSLVAAADIPLG
ncbi:MAG: SMC family ATPase [Microbacteriaceae bacterium]